VGGKKEQQMCIYAPGKSPDRSNSVVANVLNWDPAWKVEWWKDGQAMGTMEQFVGQVPLAKELYEGPSLPAKHKWVEPSLTDHLFAAFPGEGAKEIVVKVTDRFGEVFQERIMLR
jgi:hypothetical protein